MAFPKLKFNKDWRNPSDFPTYEASEEQVRADMQELHNETAEFINRVLAAYIELSYMPLTGGALGGDLRMGGHSVVFDGASIGQFNFDRGVLGLRGTNEENINLRGIAGPIEDNDAANKDYVDSASAVLEADLTAYADGLVRGLSDDLPNRFLEKGKDVDLGDYELWAKIVHANFVMAARGLEVDEGSNILFGGNRVQNVAAPVEQTDAANKDYVESYVESYAPVIKGQWRANTGVELVIPSSATNAHEYLRGLYDAGKRPELHIEGNDWIAIYHLSKVSIDYLVFSNTERWDDDTLSISTIRVSDRGCVYSAREF